MEKSAVSNRCTNSKRDVIDDEKCANLQRFSQQKQQQVQCNGHDTNKIETNRNRSGMVTIKREQLDEEIKEYAETAMNELLGWYGYTNNNNKEPKKDLVLGAMKTTPTTTTMSVTDEESTPEVQLHVHHRLQQGGKTTTTTTTQHSHTRLQTHPPEIRKSSGGNSSGSESPGKSAEICGWCGKSVDESTGLSSNNAVYCSELCFSQSRRASFKKNKTCDWCKHVRHTVSYVDFQDGASQLQFCSDKCLNQYKMHIFCRETRAHLEMHPHLAGDDTTSGLITPDLWLRNCKSPATLPTSTSPPPGGHLDDPPQTSPLPLITVAHPSKLLASPTRVKTPTPTSSSRKRRFRKRSTAPAPKHHSEIAQDLRVRHFSTETSLPNGHHDFPELSSRLFASPGGVGAFPLPPRFNGHCVQHKQSPPGAAIPTQTSAPPPPPQPPGGGFFARPSILPPVTVMVPYPVLLPVPVPIPIPLPLSAFLQAAKLKTSQKEDGSVDAVLNEPEVPRTSSPSEDEEIVVDDIREQRHKGNEGDVNEDVEHEEVPISTDSKAGECNESAPCPSIQLRKRKSDGKLLVITTHKPKKTLSV